MIANIDGPERLGPDQRLVAVQRMTMTNYPVALKGKETPGYNLTYGSNSRKVTSRSFWIGLQRE